MPAGYGPIGTASVPLTFRCMVRTRAPALSACARVPKTTAQTAFIVPEHPAMTVQVSAENLDIAQWSFSLAQPDRVHGSRQEATIPGGATGNGAFSIKFRIDQPASPSRLGLSGDIRLLGILLHRLSIAPEAGTPAGAITI